MRKYVRLFKFLRLFPLAYMGDTFSQSSGWVPLHLPLDFFLRPIDVCPLRWSLEGRRTTPVAIYQMSLGRGLDAKKRLMVPRKPDCVPDIKTVVRSDRSTLLNFFDKPVLGLARSTIKLFRHKISSSF